MRDDYAALDLFTTAAGKPGKRKNLLTLPRRKVRQSAQTLPLTAFLPLIAKIKRKPANFALQGWPVALSWSAPRSFAREEFSDFL